MFWLNPLEKVKLLLRTAKNFTAAEDYDIFQSRFVWMKVGAQKVEIKAADGLSIFRAILANYRELPEGEYIFPGYEDSPPLSQEFLAEYRMPDGNYITAGLDVDDYNNPVSRDSKNLYRQTPMTWFDLPTFEMLKALRRVQGEEFSIGFDKEKLRLFFRQPGKDDFVFEDSTDFDFYRKNKLPDDVGTYKKPFWEMALLLKRIQSKKIRMFADRDLTPIYLQWGQPLDVYFEAIISTYDVRPEKTSDDYIDELPF